MTAQVPTRVRTGRLGGRLAPVATLLALIALWEAATAIFDVPIWLIPSPSAVAAALVELRGHLLGHSWVTLVQVVGGFAVSVLVGIPLAVLIASSGFLERTIYPLLVAMQSVPKIAIAPIIVLWMGFGMTPKMVIIFLVCVFPVVISTASGLKTTPAEFVELARSLGAGRLQLFWKVRFPAAMPQIFVGLKVAITLAVIGAVIGEFVAGDEGLGYVIVLSGGNVRTDLAFAAIILLAIMSIALFYALAALERLLVPWARRQQEIAA